MTICLWEFRIYLFFEILRDIKILSDEWMLYFVDEVRTFSQLGHQLERMLFLRKWKIFMHSKIPLFSI